MKNLLLLFLICLPLHMSGEYHYNFSYTFKGQAHGRILLIIPYRVYYESSASVNFIAEKKEDGNLSFRYDGIGATGYMMRTSGFGGKILAILTADYDIDRSVLFGEKKLREIKESAPYYAHYIKRKKNFQFRILNRDSESIRFTRSPTGVHSDFFLDFPIRYKYYPENLNIDFFIYPIMMEILKGYDHPITDFKPLIRGELALGSQMKSRPLDYSPHMNRIAPLAARVMKKLKSFHQDEPFQVIYKIVADDNETVTIRGVANPEVAIWGSFLLRTFSREAVISKKGKIALRDSVEIHIANRKGNGLTVKAFLKLLEN